MKINEKKYSAKIKKTSNNLIFYAFMLKEKDIINIVI